MTKMRTRNYPKPQQSSFINLLPYLVTDASDDEAA
jgi:hypothetical protein